MLYQMCQYLSYLPENAVGNKSMFLRIRLNTYLIKKKNKFNEKHRVKYQISVYDLLLFK